LGWRHSWIDGIRSIRPANQDFSINASVYKSLTYKTAGASTYKPLDFPYKFSVQPAPLDEVN
jgi:hypothetical protein